VQDDAIVEGDEGAESEQATGGENSGLRRRSTRAFGQNLVDDRMYGAGEAFEVGSPVYTLRKDSRSRLLHEFCSSFGNNQWKGSRSHVRARS